MQTHVHPLEIEVKFYLKDPAAVRDRLLTLGTLTHPRVFETNWRYEDCEQSLKCQGKLLRLRRDRECRLTYKCKSPRSDPQFKVYQELEVTVDNADRLAAILDALGFGVVQVYEKWRETFAVKTTTVCIDTMPYGDFLEIEGDREGIKALARKLGLPWEERILTNYLAIFEVLRQQENLAFSDVTFDNFACRVVDIMPYISMFYADGRG
jgi:adenylate cyclase, class 2